MKADVGMQLGLDGSEVAPSDIARRDSRGGKALLANPMLALVGPYAGPEQPDPRAGDGRTRPTVCGDCVHLVSRLRAKRYYKCDLRSTSSSATSDHRVGWPACAKYEGAKT